MNRRTCDTEPRARWSLLGERLSTSMRRNYGGPSPTSALWLTVLLICLSLLSSQCQAETPKPLYERDVQLKVMVYKDWKATSDACHEMLLKLRPKAKKERVGGCATRMSDGKWWLQVTEPKNWCDWQTLKTWGHELMHTVDLNHTDAHVFYGGPNRWMAEACEMVDE